MLIGRLRRWWSDRHPRGGNPVTAQGLAGLLLTMPGVWHVAIRAVRSRAIVDVVVTATPERIGAGHGFVDETELALTLVMPVHIRTSVSTRTARWWDRLRWVWRAWSYEEIE